MFFNLKFLRLVWSVRFRRTIFAIFYRLTLTLGNIVCYRHLFWCKKLYIHIISSCRLSKRLSRLLLWSCMCSLTSPLYTWCYRMIIKTTVVFESTVGIFFRIRQHCSRSAASPRTIIHQFGRLKLAGVVGCLIKESLNKMARQRTYWQNCCSFLWNHDQSLYFILTFTNIIFLFAYYCILKMIFKWLWFSPGRFF